jgi:hypothetical protein
MACEPGCIYFSDKVYDDIRNKTEITAEYLGEQELKNIGQPVKIYRISYETILQQHEPESARIPEEIKQDMVPVKGRIPVLKRMGILIPSLIVIIAALYFLFNQYISRSSPDQARIPIAVISFENQTGDTSLNYLQKAIPNLIIAISTGMFPLPTAYTSLRGDIKGLLAGVDDFISCPPLRRGYICPGIFNAIIKILPYLSHHNNLMLNYKYFHRVY